MIGKIIYLIIASMTVLMGVLVFLGALSIEIAHKIQEWIEGKD